MCDLPCSGDEDQTCGGYTAISVYEYITYPFVGCFKDSRDRVLSGQFFRSDDMTTEVRRCCRQLFNRSGLVRNIRGVGLDPEVLKKNAWASVYLIFAVFYCERTVTAVYIASLSYPRSNQLYIFT